jgi:uncharacterized SAM-binding protein YcdF (DUF218 family)
MRRVVVALVLAVVLLWLASLAAVFTAARRDAAAPADAIVVLGAAQYDGRPSPVFRARLDHAVALFRRGLAPRVVVTGGTGTGDTVSEATVGRRYLLAAGLPGSAVDAESAGRSSAPSLRAAADRVHAAGGARVILVSDGFHMLRLKFLAHRFGLAAVGSPAPASPITSNSRRELGYLLAESVKAPAALLFSR